MKHNNKNGYSIAEILLVFGIIAGVLIGVWAMYTMLSDNVEVQKAIAEIQMIRDAAVQFKSTSGTGNYDLRLGSSIEGFKSYLGKLGDEPHVVGAKWFTITNIFGGELELHHEKPPESPYENIYVRSKRLPSLEICRQILERFGEVEEGGKNKYFIGNGKAVFGYVGGANSNYSGCKRTPKKIIVLNLVID